MTEKDIISKINTVENKEKLNYIINDLTLMDNNEYREYITDILKSKMAFLDEKHKFFEYVQSSEIKCLYFKVVNYPLNLGFTLNSEINNSDLEICNKFAVKINVMNDENTIILTGHLYFKYIKSKLYSGDFYFDDDDFHLTDTLISGLSKDDYYLILEHMIKYISEIFHIYNYHCKSTL